MPAPLSDSASESAPASRSWLTFTLLTLALTGGGIVLVRVLKPAALQNLFSRSDPVQEKRGLSISNLKWIEEALLVYAHDHGGSYPATLEPLAAPGAKSYFAERTSVPLDAWNRPFVYTPPTSAHAAPHLVSLGADGQPGGAGENADIDSDALQL